MTTLESLRQALPEYAKDIRLNLGSLLGPEGLAELSPAQKWGAAIAATLAARQPALTAVIAAEAAGRIDTATAEAARSAAALMAMTNVYYRAVHMADDADLSRLPLGLRMNAMVRHGIAQSDFELFGLAASVVKGCEGCTRAHIDGARKHGVTTPAIQAVLKLAAVIHAAATVLDAVPASAAAA
jgi:alkyl hydroperoxide reductase subunit D